jgi:hypothetical protein
MSFPKWTSKLTRYRGGIQSERELSESDSVPGKLLHQEVDDVQKRV